MGALLTLALVIFFMSGQWCRVVEWIMDLFDNKHKK